MTSGRYEPGRRLIRPPVLSFRELGMGALGRSRSRHFRRTLFESSQHPEVVRKYRPGDPGSPISVTLGSEQTGQHFVLEDADAPLGLRPPGLERAEDLIGAPALEFGGIARAHAVDNIFALKKFPVGFALKASISSNANRAVSN